MIIYIFTFMHLAEYFIQSNVKVMHFTSMCFPKESNPLLWCCQYESKYLLREVLQTLNTTCTFSCEVTMVP